MGVGQLVNHIVHRQDSWAGTLSLVESFLESEVPHLRLFLVKYCFCYTLYSSLIK